MTRWIVVRNIPYEGLHEDFCDSAKEVVDLINDMPTLSKDDIEGIRPASGTYDLWEFLAAFERGEVV